jgi:hypothetical protein
MSAANRSSPADSPKLRAFALTFSLVGPVAYCVIQYLNLPLATFWPATNRLVWGFETGRPNEGPNMLWYGWTLSTIIVAAAIGIIAMLLPARIANRLPLALLWILPILSIPYIVYSLMAWWKLAAGH